MAVREVLVSPELFPGFHDVAVLGVGRRSTVYRAVENGTNRPVALKVVGTEGTTPAALEAFGRESAVLAALGGHPHIVTLYRTLAIAPRPILVLELCRGSLASRLRRGRMPLSEAVAATVRIAGALETAHSAGVLHRNVCPANILITEFGEPALSDFAIARLHDAGIPAAELLDYPGPHAAPEVLLGQQADQRADVYGLASTLYELVAGRPAFAEMAGEPAAATILRILRDPPRALTGAPLELSDVVLWGLAKEPADRPPTVAWFADELRRVESQQHWPRTDLLVRTAPAPVSMPPTPPAPPARSAAHSIAPPPAPPVVAAPPPAPPVVAAPPPAAAPPVAVPVPETAPGPIATAPPGAPVAAAPPAGRLVVRGPLLASLGRIAILVSPVWAAVVAVLVATDPGPVGITAGVAALVLSALLAVWFARPVLIAETCHLIHRDGLTRVLVPWPAVHGVHPVFEPSRRPGAPHGLLVVSGRARQLLLTATRRSCWQLTGLALVLVQRRDAARRGGDTFWP